MGAYKYVEELWKKKQSDVMRFLARVRTWEYRQLSRLHKCSRPTRPEKARHLGYKAKAGFTIYRSRVRRGGRKKDVSKGIVYGKPKNHCVNKHNPRMNCRALAEQRLGRKYGSLRVLNSYWIAQDAVYKWYEVIMVDPYATAIRADPRINWICKANKKHREMRGVTSAGRKHRGLLTKGARRTCHLRPSRHAAWKRNHRISLLRKR